MAPGSIFHHISFRSTILVSYLLSLQSFTFSSINQKYQKYYFTVYPSISDHTLQITVKGLTTPLSRLLQVGVCLCRYLVACCVVSNWIDTLVLKTEGNTYATLLHHPFLFEGKPTHAQEVEEPHMAKQSTCVSMGCPPPPYIKKWRRGGPALPWRAQGGESYSQ